MHLHMLLYGQITLLRLIIMMFSLLYFKAFPGYRIKAWFDVGQGRFGLFHDVMKCLHYVEIKDKLDEAGPRFVFHSKTSSKF